MAKKEFYAAVGTYPKNQPEFAERKAAALREKKIDGVKLQEEEDCINVVVGPFDSNEQAGAIVAILADYGVNAVISSQNKLKAKEEAKAERTEE